MYYVDSDCWLKMQGIQFIRYTRFGLFLKFLRFIYYHTSKDKQYYEHKYSWLYINKYMRAYFTEENPSSLTTIITLFSSSWNLVERGITYHWVDLTYIGFTRLSTFTSYILDVLSPTYHFRTIARIIWTHLSSVYRLMSDKRLIS